MKNSSSEVVAHPEGILLSSEALSEKDIHATKELFKLAGVMPDATLVQDNSGELSEMTP